MRLVALAHARSRTQPPRTLSSLSPNLRSGCGVMSATLARSRRSVKAMRGASVIAASACSELPMKDLMSGPTLRHLHARVRGVV